MGEGAEDSRAEERRIERDMRMASEPARMLLDATGGVGSGIGTEREEKGQQENENETNIGQVHNPFLRLLRGSENEGEDVTMKAEGEEKVTLGFLGCFFFISSLSQSHPSTYTKVRLTIIHTHSG